MYAYTFISNYQYMKNNPFKNLTLLSLLLMSLYSCRKDVQQLQVAPPDQSAGTDLFAAGLPGRSLAANCFQCHGTNGHTTSDMGLAGKSASKIIDEINDMKRKNPAENIMNMHAQAYTDAEIKLIADFFSKQ